MTREMLLVTPRGITRDAALRKLSFSVNKTIDWEFGLKGKGTLTSNLNNTCRLLFNCRADSRENHSTLLHQTSWRAPEYCSLQTWWRSPHKYLDTALENSIGSVLPLRVTQPTQTDSRGGFRPRFLPQIWHRIKQSTRDDGVVWDKTSSVSSKFSPMNSNFPAAKPPTVPVVWIQDKDGLLRFAWNFSGDEQCGQVRNKSNTRSLC